MKKLLSVILTAVILLVPMSVCVFAEDTAAVEAEPAEAAALTLASVADVATFILEPVPWGEIQIAPAVLQNEDGEQDVWLVALRGTGFSMNKTNNIIACFLSAFNLKSKFYELTLSYVNQYVPEGAKVVFAGHSLGGMIEQQLSCAPEFTDKYELLNTLCMGSPYVMTDASKREGTLSRCIDTYDVIPRLGPGSLFDFGNFSRYTMLDAGYLGDPNGAHNNSYMKADVWGGYDAFGVQGGSAKLTIQNGDVITLRS